MSTPSASPQPAPPQSSSSEHAEPPKKTRRLGQYELLAKIGQGAMGTVYLARHVSQGRQVALKILPQEMARDQEFLERFRREARAALKLSHPNIVAAYDIGVADSYHFIAMEYVEGKDLEVLLASKKRFEEQELLKIALDVCAALQAAHEQGIVHRDLKPGNILLTGQGTAKLIDLGLASASGGERRVTIAGYAVGTPYYISPEQAKGTLEIDHRADFYGLGATLYHLATGELPFPGINPVVIMSQHLTEEPPPPHIRNPAVSKRLSALIRRMMIKDPARRYQNAIELRADIERVLRGEMPSPPPELRIEAVTPSPPPMVEGPAAKRGSSLDERLLEQLDDWLVFLPGAWRLPVAAVCATLMFLCLVAALIALLRGS